jgi:hypothetical protein
MSEDLMSKLFTVIWKNAEIGFFLNSKWPWTFQNNLYSPWTASPCLKAPLYSRTSISDERITRSELGWTDGWTDRRTYERTDTMAQYAPPIFLRGAYKHYSVFHMCYFLRYWILMLMSTYKPSRVTKRKTSVSPLPTSFLCVYITIFIITCIWYFFYLCTVFWNIQYFVLHMTSLHNVVPEIFNNSSISTSFFCNYLPF